MSPLPPIISSPNSKSSNPLKLGLLKILFIGLRSNILSELFCSHFFSEVLLCANLEIIVLQDCVALLEFCFFLVVCRPTDLCVRIRKSFVEVFLSLVYVGFVCVAAFFFWAMYSKQQPALVSILSAESIFVTNKTSTFGAVSFARTWPKTSKFPLNSTFVSSSFIRDSASS